MKKRFFGLLLAGALTLALAVPAGAECRPSLQVDGTRLACVPQLSGGRSYLPAEELAAALGAEASRQGEEVALARNGRSVTLPVAWEQEGEAFLPLRAAGTALGYQVGWDRESRTVILVDLEALTGETAGEEQSWRLAETQVQAGPLTRQVEACAAALAGAVDPGCLLSLIPLTDSEGAAALVAQAAEALKGTESGTFTAGGVQVSVAHGDGDTVLTLALPAKALFPAERLGLGEKTLTLTVRTGADEARAVATVGSWTASARWTA